MKPKVSIIIPNYNYCKFLEERLNSIISQSFTDYELIFLDDASEDGSIAFFDSYIKKYPKIQFVKHVNTLNTGNPFKQWNKGVALAKGRYIWIAEADDFCSPDFLERLVRILDEHPGVGIAYCQSCHVDKRSENLGSIVWSVEWMDRERWKYDFINNGHGEIINYLLFQNTIPNASAVLLRKSVFEQVGHAAANYTLMGDWFTWIKMLSMSDVAFVAKECNFFRVHDCSVRSEFDTQRQISFIKELYLLAHETTHFINPGRQRLNAVKKHYAAITSHKLWGEKFSITKLPAYFLAFSIAMRFDPLLPLRLIKMLLKK